MAYLTDANGDLLTDKANSSGTYSYEQNLADLGIEVFERLRIKLTEADATLWASLRRSMNLVNARWANLGVNLWKVALLTQPMTEGVAQYAVPAYALNVLDVYREMTIGGSPIDTLMYPLSRNEWAGIPDKTQQGTPTSFWFDRTQLPTLNVWPVPDGNGPYTLCAWLSQQIQDATPGGAVTSDLPFAFYEAYAAAVTAHMAVKWAPDRAVAFEALAEKLWQEAADENREKVPFRIVPSLGSYFGNR